MPKQVPCNKGKHRFRALQTLVSAFVLTGFVTACGPGFVKSRASREPASMSAIEVRADWNDLDAAMEVATTKAEAAIVRRDELDGRELRFALITLGDEDGTLLATPLAPITRDTMPIRLEARFGVNGDADRERLFLDALARRLRQLAGKDWAPLH